MQKQRTGCGEDHEKSVMKFEDGGGERYQGGSGGKRIYMMEEWE
jgi:hypothetical protein